MKKTIQTIHWITVVSVIINIVLDEFFAFSFSSQIELSIKIIVIITGLILFFFYRKPFQKISYYFTIFPVFVSLLLIGYLIRGMIGGLLLFVLLAPIYPDKMELEQNQIRIYQPTTFMVMCCKYEVREQKYWLFEKKYQRIILEETINFDNITIANTQNEIHLTYPDKINTNNEVTITIRKTTKDKVVIE